MPEPVSTESSFVVSPRWMQSRHRVATALLLILAAGCGALLLPAAARAQNPATCEGYPEPRRYMASQSWWTDSQANFSGGLGGLTEHSHTDTCFPLYQIVNGVVRFDVRSTLHNLPGHHARVRIQDGSTTLLQADTAVCSANDCTFTTTLNVNLGALATGTHEIRIHTVARAGTPGSANYSKENLATNGWQLCVRSCAVRATTVPWPQNEGRGWYDTPSIDVKGYINARLVSPLPATPVSGRWCPTVRILKGGVEGVDDTPVNRSFASVDPNFHGGSAGRVILDQAGTYGGTGGAALCVETTQLTNGPHQLFLRAYSDGTFAGQLWGALVVPFNVAN